MHLTPLFKEKYLKLLLFICFLVMEEASLAENTSGTELTYDCNSTTVNFSTSRNHSTFSNCTAVD